MNMKSLQKRKKKNLTKTVLSEKEKAIIITTNYIPKKKLQANKPTSIWQCSKS